MEKTDDVRYDFLDKKWCNGRLTENIKKYIKNQSNNILILTTGINNDSSELYIQNIIKESKQKLDVICVCVGQRG